MAILKASAKTLAGNLETFGFIFECMCVWDILVYARAIDAEVYYYRGSDNLEVDLVVESLDGAWAACVWHA